MELFHQEIHPKRQEVGEKMRLQTDLEFQQNEIKRLNEKYNVDMFSSKLEEGKLSQPSKKLENLRN